MICQAHELKMFQDNPNVKLACDIFSYKKQFILDQITQPILSYYKSRLKFRTSATSYTL